VDVPLQLELREPECREQGRGRREPVQAADQRHERDEPDEVLRGEHLCEDQKRRHRGDVRSDETLLALGAAEVEPRHADDCSELHEGREHRDGVGDDAREVDRPRRAGDDPSAVHAELICDEQERGPETLDLELPSRL